MAILQQENFTADREFIPSPLRLFPPGIDGSSDSGTLKAPDGVKNPYLTKPLDRMLDLALNDLAVHFMNLHIDGFE